MAGIVDLIECRSHEAKMIRSDNCCLPCGENLLTNVKNKRQVSIGVYLEINASPAHGSSKGGSLASKSLVDGKLHFERRREETHRKKGKSKHRREVFNLTSTMCAVVCGILVLMWKVKGRKLPG